MTPQDVLVELRAEPVLWDLAPAPIPVTWAELADARPRSARQAGWSWPSRRPACRRRRGGRRRDRRHLGRHARAADAQLRRPRAGQVGRAAHRPARPQGLAPAAGRAQAPVPAAHLAVRLGRDLGHGRWLLPGHVRRVPGGRRRPTRPAGAGPAGRRLPRPGRRLDRAGPDGRDRGRGRPWPGRRPCSTAAGGWSRSGAGPRPPTWPPFRPSSPPSPRGRRPQPLDPARSPACSPTSAAGSWTWPRPRRRPPPPARGCPSRQIASRPRPELPEESR